MEIRLIGALILADAPAKLIEYCELEALINNAEHDLESCIGYPQEDAKRDELNALYTQLEALDVNDNDL